MKKLSILFFLGFLLLGADKTSTGQQDLMLFSMDAVPQHMYNNPSSRPSTRLNIGLPGLSSIYLRHENTIYNPFHLFEQRGSNSALRTEHFLNQTRKVNTLGYDLAVDLLSFGFAVGETDYFSFSIRERVQGRWSIPGDMVRFPFTGNASFDELEDGTLDFSDFRIGVNHYREMGFGWQHDWNDKLSVGGRLKLLYGYENIDTKASTMTWKTDEETYDWTFAGELDIHSSGLWMLADSLDDNSDLEQDAIADYLLKRKNYGLGIDLGATYQINDKLSVNASISDLGYINWKSYTQNLNTSNGEFMFTGLEISEETAFYDGDTSDTLDVIVEDMLEDLEASFALEDNEEAYRSALLARLHVGASYELYETNNTAGTAGFLMQSEFYKGRMRPTFGISYQQRVGRWLTAQLGYSVIDRNFRNLGMGLSMNAGPVQFYVTTDNLLAGVLDRFTFDDEASTSDGSFVYSSYAKTMQIHTGINLTFGRKPNDMDGDGIVDKKDACPEIPGLEEFAGCPDSDGDGIEDKLDSCPDTPGLQQFSGCPDTDGDGIEDKSDVCPEVPGIPAFEGCPDTDEDGIQDSEDDCIEIAGTAEFKGCPDTDGDGLRDLDDSCPEEAGPLENKGCPWGDIDNDTVLDKDDRCPDTAGPVENDGCPWADTDGDTVFDKDDACPLTPGAVENRGCPVIEEEEQEILNTAFQNLEFLSGKAVIKEESKPSLLELADLLIKKDTWKLQIAGHTDDVGAAATNLELSKKRSNAVADFIESRGVAKERMIIQWFGETDPIGDNKTNEGRQLNRRVEMTVVFD
jgi:outer membrane protein OmpA-like peptidoglycan-associated protein